MCRRKSKAMNSVSAMCLSQNMNPDVLFQKAKLLLGAYSLETYVGTASESFLESVNWALAISVGLHPKICNINYGDIPENQRPMNKERRT